MRLQGFNWSSNSKPPKLIGVNFPSVDDVRRHLETRHTVIGSKYLQASIICDGILDPPGSLLPMSQIERELLLRASELKRLTSSSWDRKLVDEIGGELERSRSTDCRSEVRDHLVAWAARYATAAGYFAAAHTFVTFASPDSQELITNDVHGVTLRKALNAISNSYLQPRRTLGDSLDAIDGAQRIIETAHPDVRPELQAALSLRVFDDVIRFANKAQLHWAVLLAEKIQPIEDRHAVRQCLNGFVYKTAIDIAREYGMDAVKGLINDGVTEDAREEVRRRIREVALPPRAVSYDQIIEEFGRRQRSRVEEGYRDRPGVKRLDPTNSESRVNRLMACTTVSNRIFLMAIPTEAIVQLDKFLGDLDRDASFVPTSELVDSAKSALHEARMDVPDSHVERALLILESARERLARTEMVYPSLLE